LFGRVDVSPVRLAIHLGMAFAIQGAAFWLALDALGVSRANSKLEAPAWAPAALAGLIFAQVIFGALLAGADGGPAYADWPTIGGEWIPSRAFALEPVWRNLAENHATQHLLHRTLGYVVALSALALAITAWRRGAGGLRTLALALGALALAQAGLGVATVLLATPMHAALTHQLGAAALWMCAVAAAWQSGSRIIPSP
jgi:cytochrome c oxidase assembly protein subunit 15